MTQLEPENNTTIPEWALEVENRGVEPTSMSTLSDPPTDSIPYSKPLYGILTHQKALGTKSKLLSTGL